MVGGQLTAADSHPSLAPGLHLKDLTKSRNPHVSLGRFITGLPVPEHSQHSAADIRHISAVLTFTFHFLQSIFDRQGYKVGCALLINGLCKVQPSLYVSSTQSCGYKWK